MTPQAPFASFSFLLDLRFWSKRSLHPLVVGLKKSFSSGVCVADPLTPFSLLPPTTATQWSQLRNLQHPQGSACPVKTPTYPHQLTTVTRVEPCQTHKWALVPASGSRQEGAPPIYYISCKANTHRFGRAARCRS